SKDKSNQPKFKKIDGGLEVRKGAEDKDYLDSGDIEGQEFGKEADEEEEGDQRPKKKNRLEEVPRNEYSEEEEEEEDFVPGDEFANDDDAPRARRKSKKGMGFLLSKFNMAEELQEGRMAADGSYVASAKDPEAVNDNWVEGVNSKKAIKLACQAKRLREHMFLLSFSCSIQFLKTDHPPFSLVEQQHSQVEKEESMGSLRTRKDCCITPLGLLPHGDGQPVTQILCEETEHPEEDSTMINNESAKKNDDNPEQKEESIRRKTRTQLKTEEDIKLDKRIEEITDLSSMLMGTHEELDMYDMSHGSIVGILKSEGLVPRDRIPPSSSNNNIQEEVSKSTEEVTSNRNYKTEQYDQALQGYEKATIKIYKSSAYLNIGQSVIFSLSIMVVM
ncbi:hypothetical protein MJO28_007072, partial [Puccinia striiformis f. sp. tritici]